MISRTLFFLVAVLFSSISWPLDNTIRVLGVSTSAVDANADYKANAESALQYLVQGWNGSNMPGKAGVSITIVNGGVPVPLGSTITGSTLLQRMDAAEAIIKAQGVRYDHQADIVLIIDAFTGTTKCGHAQAPDGWVSTGETEFIPDANGLDTRGKNTSYFAIIDIRCSRWQYLAGHEFGHLLGGAHPVGFDAGPDFHPGLYDDSHAWVEYISLMGATREIFTLIATNRSCLDGPSLCVPNHRYSDNIVGWGNNSSENVRALVKTAKSVANYDNYIAPLKKPKNVSGFFTYCSDSVNTVAHHALSWKEGGSGVDIDEFEIWTEQPIGTGYNYDWSVDGSETDSSVYVYGAPARLKVRACVDGTCTGLSDSFYQAELYYCNQPGW